MTTGPRNMGPFDVFDGSFEEVETVTAFALTPEQEEKLTAQLLRSPFWQNN